MPFVERPADYKIGEDSASLDLFLRRMGKVVDHTKPYGIAIVLFDQDGCCHGYQYGLRDGDFEAAQMILAEHQNMTTE